MHHHSFSLCAVFNGGIGNFSSAAIPLDAMLSDLSVTDISPSLLSVKAELDMNEDDILAITLMHEKIVKVCEPRCVDPSGLSYPRACAGACF